MSETLTIERLSSLVGTISKVAIVVLLITQPKIVWTTHKFIKTRPLYWENALRQLTDKGIIKRKAEKRIHGRGGGKYYYIYTLSRETEAILAKIYKTTSGKKAFIKLLERIQSKEDDISDFPQKFQKILEQGQ